MKKTSIKKDFTLSFLEGIIAFVLWQVSLYIIDDDIGFVGNAFLMLITYLIASNIIRKYFKK